jgi:hypothetical protein
MPGGTLATPWRATNAYSFDTNGFGIADGPVESCGAGVLADGRAAIAFEHWVQVAEGIEPRLSVRTWDGRGWAQVGQDISLSSTGKPYSFSGSEFNFWPTDPRSHQQVRYWNGSCRVQFGALEFWYAGWFYAVDVRIGAVHNSIGNDGVAGQVDQLTLLRWTSEFRKEVCLVIWRLQAGHWVEKCAAETPPYVQEPYSADSTIRMRKNTTIDVDKAGNVYLCVARQIVVDKADTCTRTYPVEIVRYPGDGQEKLVTWALNTQEYNRLGEPTGRVVLFVHGAFPLLGIEYTMGHGKRVWGYLKLVENTWTPLWRGKDAFDAAQFDMPMGQAPDGYPVWLYTKKALNDSIWGQAYFAEWRSLANGGQFIEERLPMFQSGSFTDVWPNSGKSIIWYHGQPMLAVAGVSRYGNDETSINKQRLHVALWTRCDGRWINVGATTRPAYTRPFHCGHDGISGACAVVSAKSEALLLWFNNLPVEGPAGTYAAVTTIRP